MKTPPLVASSSIIEDAVEGRRGPSQQRIAETGLEWIELLLRKNADYGSAVWDAPVLAPNASVDLAIRVRMSDKISRLQCLLSSGGNPEVSESIDDTMRDLGAYALLWLARPT